MTRPEIVLFDIGNVLIEWQPERYFDTVMSVAKRKLMFATVDLHAMNDRIDRGGGFRQTIYQTARQYPEFADQIRMWHDNWLDLATPEIEQSVALNRSLRSNGVATAILSNIGRDTYELAAKRYPFLTEFDHHFLSGPLETLKPEAAIYQVVEDRLGIAPDRLLFTDDRPENIAAAGQRGWQTHHFIRPDGWADALASHGLLPDRSTK